MKYRNALLVLVSQKQIYGLFYVKLHSEHFLLMYLGPLGPCNLLADLWPGLEVLGKTGRGFSGGWIPPQL